MEAKCLLKGMGSFSTTGSSSNLFICLKKKITVLKSARHAHYTLGVTPLVLRWKDSTCSQYVIDTDNNGVVSSNQMVPHHYCHYASSFQ